MPENQRMVTGVFWMGKYGIAHIYNTKDLS